ncbi:hypothetical protein BDZ45DRAFT_605753 [Acephala macrosclerotiorum]|nr:hypothetical protein BDZ45DRAFT_605753 [Acephala macrosclerotiorum]
MYSIPTVPSQPARQPIANTLELRRQNTRKRRHMRFSRNPIVDSPQYQAYRARQNRDGNPNELKWPEILEVAFLDALVEIPTMNKCKYSYGGKPHGRNELIKEYLWIAYLQSLPMGAHPDIGMMRTRKQVSSHIQVLKGFLRDHPAFPRLFPPKKSPKNGFEDSFKDDPCLKALSEGRLPNKRYDQYDNINHMISINHNPVRPVLFWLLMSTISNFREGDNNDEGEVAHRFTNISVEKHRDSLESVIGWRQKFPRLHQLDMDGELNNCDIIHMSAALNLLAAEPPPGSELISQSILSIPGKQPSHCSWRMVTTLHKPPELYRDPIMDERLENEAQSVDIISVSDAETRIKASFPIFHWAHAFSCLVGIQSQYEEQQRSLQTYGSTSEPLVRPACDFVEQVAMYQEVQSAAGPAMPFIRRAVIIWTFHQTGEGEGNGTNWRYLEPPPARRMCMSPSPHPSHLVSSAMNENFNDWAEAPLHLQQPNMLDPFVQDLATPPQTAGLQSPFGALSGYPFSAPGYNLPIENLSFVSTSTVDSEATLVDHDASAVANIDHFLSNVNMADYNQDASTWQLPTTQNFDADPAWAAYNNPSSTPAVGWDDSKNHSWPDLPDPKHMNWAEETSPKHEWTEASSPSKHLTFPEHTSPGKHLGYIEPSPSKHANYIEQSIEQKLLPWIEGHPNGDVHEPTLHDLSTEPLQEIDTNGNGATQTPKAGIEEWSHPDDGFDYTQLERLK